MSNPSMPRCLVGWLRKTAKPAPDLRGALILTLPTWRKATRTPEVGGDYRTASSPVAGSPRCQSLAAEVEARKDAAWLARTLVAPGARSRTCTSRRALTNGAALELLGAVKATSAWCVPKKWQETAIHSPYVLGEKLAGS